MDSQQNIEVRKERVAHVVKDAGMSLVDKHYHPVEVICGVAELLGRLIASQEGTFVVHNQLLDFAKSHLSTTVQAAYAAKGQNPEAIK